ncbi:MAG TPA: hypothetical protein VFV52_13750 [Bacilli bacterium]|nr:hypothetical protein [Bacilli bacterium]
MWGNLFWIFFRPNRTMDRILEERRNGQSWGVTWLLLGLNLAVSLLMCWYVWRIGDVIGSAAENEVASSMLGGLFLIPVIVGIIVSIAFYPLSRYFFAWFVQLGLKVSAGRSLPEEREERREAAYLLRLIQPYTLWVLLFPNLLVAAGLFLTIDIPGLMEQSITAGMAGAKEPPAELFQTMMGMMIWSLIAQVMQLGMLIYILVQRTFAIKKIYRVSGAQAFWGPFLIYFLSYVLLFLLYIVGIVLLVTLSGSDFGYDPASHL